MTHRKVRRLAAWRPAASVLVTLALLGLGTAPGMLAPAARAAATAAAAPDNLIKNGGFEEPACPPQVCEYPGGDSSDVPGWTVGGSSVDIVGAAYFQPAGGSQSLDLSGSAPGSVTQRIGTVKGTLYTLSWDLAGNPVCGQPIKTMHVYWDGDLVAEPKFDTETHTTSAMGWQRHQLTVEATGDISKVKFADATTDRSQCGATIDNVTLTKLPAVKLAALGDSFSAGNGAPGVSGECVRSPLAWPNLIQNLPAGKDFRQATYLLACSGANSYGADASPKQDLPAQIGALRILRPEPTFITITIGGDDGREVNAGFFKVLLACRAGQTLCEGAISREDAWLTKREPAILHHDFAALRAAAPHATILVAGYPHLFSAGACAGFGAHVVTQLNEIGDRLDVLIERAAKTVTDVHFVDLRPVFKNDETCSSKPWFNKPPHGASSGWYHPNLAGQQAIARAVAADL
jgi:choice-of-anchor C domain-containing protein